MTGLDRLRIGNRVDGLLSPWADGIRPGVTLAILQAGEVLLHRSAGLANLEHRVPIGPQTRFRIASVSKQFTTAAILMLAQDGHLDIEAPARAYLPELPEYGHAVTVAHLMHNTSGIRDMLEVMRQGGADLGTPVTAQALLDAITRQRSLNFVPGTRFLYSNSNFLLLGLIAERIAGLDLPTLLEQRIFAPLGMTATQMTPDLRTPIPGLATGYLPHGTSWLRAAHAFPLGGEGGLVSTVLDLAAWDRNLATGRIGGAWLAAELSRQTPFTNGTENRYARGQIVRPYRGLRTISHGGLWPGYKTEFLRVPDADTTVICISNDGGADPNHLAHQALDVVLDGRPGLHPVPAMPAPDAFRTLPGRYLDPDGPATVDIALNASGHPTLTLNGLSATAEVLADGRLASPRSSSVFSLRPLGPDAVEVEQDAGTRGTWHRVAPGAPLPEGLAGTYHSPEMAASWTLATDDVPQVTATGPVATGQPWPVQPVQGDVFRILVPGTLFQAWLDVRAERRGDGTVTGLLVNGGRAKQVRYVRTG